MDVFTNSVQKIIKEIEEEKLQSNNDYNDILFGINNSTDKSPFFKRIFETSSCFCDTNLNCDEFCNHGECLTITEQISNNVCQRIIKDNGKDNKLLMEKILMFVPRNSTMPVINDMYNIDLENTKIEDRKIKLWLLGLSVNKIKLIENVEHFDKYVDFIIECFGKLDKKFRPKEDTKEAYFQKKEYIKTKITKGMNIIHDHLLKTNTCNHHKELCNSINVFLQKNSSDFMFNNMIKKTEALKKPLVFDKKSTRKMKKPSKFSPGMLPKSYKGPVPMFRGGKAKSLKKSITRKGKKYSKKLMLSRVSRVNKSKKNKKA